MLARLGHGVVCLALGVPFVTSPIAQIQAIAALRTAMPHSARRPSNERLLGWHRG